MPLPKNWDSWEFTEKVIKIGHNRAVKKHFKDVIGDDSRSNGRQATKTALFIRDEDSALEVLNKQMYFQGITRSDNPIATIPEWWPGRVGSDIPQLVIAYKVTNKRTTYQITIPHYNGNRNPIIPNYKKGSYRGELVCKDNSKLVVNAASEGEAFRVINILKRYIQSSMISRVKPTVKRIRGNGFKEVEVIPKCADFYPQGQENGGVSSWRKYF